ncbi:MAG: glycosyl hydrolase family 8 [Candidatus Vecturithrix sp.]|jgi:endo-1,4-beta-D-glucanase Y|nr:glycosyl hydrolase family 8 [Candidatus Vecturithrix sp.]
MKTFYIVIGLSLFGFSWLLCSACPVWAEARRPFPQHVVYTPGTIKPDHVTQTQLDRAVSAFYAAWKTQYLKTGDSEGCQPGRYYVRFSPDGPTIAVSEGQGYGMIITALMAGSDSNAKTYFDGLYWYYKDHPSQNHPYLMAWKQVSGCVTPSEENSSATDGDMDIAYALLFADAQWGSTGTINYRQEALNVMQAIMAQDINPNTWSIMLGDWVEPAEPVYYYGTRTSDFMLNHLRAYQTMSGDARWGQVLTTTYNLIHAMQTTYSPNTGLLPDFIQNLNSTPQPAASSYLEGPYDGQYNYNACRDPWRIGVEYLLSADPRAKAAADAINTWIRNKTGNDPAAIHAGYDLNGADLPDNDYISMAFVAPLGVSAMVDSSNQAWLNSVWNLVVNQPLDAYYEDTLKLLAMLVMSGNWWSPSASSSYLLWTK